MRVVLDANIYISSLISTQGNPRKIMEKWEEGAFEVFVTQAILAEVGRVLRYPRIVARHGKDEGKIGRFLKLLATQATMVETGETITVVTDETDNRYLECAIAAKASYIVSGDNHLLTVGSYKGIIILPPAAFVALLDASLG